MKTGARPSSRQVVTAAGTLLPPLEWAPVLVRDRDGTIRHWSLALQDLYGWSPQEACGRNCHDLLETSFPRPLVEIEVELAATGKVELELHRRHRSGRVIIAASRWALRCDVDGQTASVVETDADITRFRGGQGDFGGYGSALDRLVRMLEAVPDATIVSDRRGHILAVNARAERLFGYSRDNLVGKPLEMLLPERSRALHGSLRAGYFANPRPRAMEAGFEFSALRADGTEFPAEVSLAPLPVDGGMVVSAAIRDVSERKQADALLRRSEAVAHRNAELFDLITASAPEGVLVVDEHARLVYANPVCREIIGKPITLGTDDWQRASKELVVEQGVPLSMWDGPIMRALRGENADNARLVIRYPGGNSVRHIDVTSRPVRDRSGAVTGAVAVVRDVTRAVETELQLRHAQKMDAVGQLTGGIAHDFNNILTVITGTINILVDGVRDRPALAAVARMIEEAAARGSAMTRHLLAIARKQPLQPSETDVNALLLETTELLRPALGRHIEIERKLAPDVWTAMVDPTQISIAVINLAMNARDAMPHGGKISFETANAVLNDARIRDHSDVQPGAYVSIVVRDDGAGIPAAIRHKVFEPFFTTKDIGRGTGLGLSMVYGFVKQSGGHVELDSEEGRGTTIKLYLPRSSGVHTPAAPIVYSGAQAHAACFDSAEGAG
jgi:PAS domain S-box-containing protein